MLPLLVLENMTLKSLSDYGVFRLSFCLYVVSMFYRCFLCSFFLLFLFLFYFWLIGVLQIRAYICAISAIFTAMCCCLRIYFSLLLFLFLFIFLLAVRNLLFTARFYSPNSMLCRTFLLRNPPRNRFG